jgi:hypothetical protein
VYGIEPRIEKDEQRAGRRAGILHPAQRVPDHDHEDCRAAEGVDPDVSFVAYGHSDELAADPQRNTNVSLTSRT